MNVKYLFLLLFFLISAETYGTDNMSFRSYGLEFGLSDNCIRDIAEDKYGYIWIATDEGLNRVAGSRIEKFYKSTSGSWLSGNELNCLIDDPEKPVMWIGTQRDGLISYNYETGEFRHYRKRSHDPECIVTNEVTGIDFDNDWNLWLSTYSWGIDKMDVANGVFTHYNAGNTPGLASNEFWCLDYDRWTGDVYGGHVRDGLSIISPSKGSARNFNETTGLAGNEVWDIVSDKRSVWIATDKGLCGYDKATGKIKRFTSQDFSSGCRSLIDRDSVLLVAMDDHGVLAFDKETETFGKLPVRFTCRPEDHPGFLLRSDANSLFADSNGNILVGSLYEGLTVIKPDTEGFMVVGIAETGETGNPFPQMINVRDIAAGKRGVWFASNGNGLVGSYGVKTADRDVVAVFCDDNTLWVVGDRNELTGIDLRTGGRTRYDIDKIDGTKAVSFASRGDTLLVGCSDGLYVMDKNRGKVMRRMSIDRNYIMSIDIDRNGNIWVGSYGDGVSVLDRDGNVLKRHTKRTGLPSNTINDICVEGDNVWLASGEGVVRIEGDDIDNPVVVADSMRSIKSIVGDREGNVWYATRLGIGVITTDGRRKFYDKVLPVSGFNNYSAAAGSDGRLYFGSNYGVLTFDPADILSGKWMPQPVISGFTVNGGKNDADRNLIISGKKQIRLSHDQNNFTVTVTPSDFFTDRFSFEYRLIGLDDNWYPVQDNGEVILRDLPYGRYEFQVRNTSADNPGTAPEASLIIRISPPFWLQWWAKLIYLLLFAAAGYVLFVLYRNRLRRRAMLTVEEERLSNQKTLHEERVRFFTNVTHELRTPLTLINGPLEDLLKGDSLVKDDRWKVDVIHKNAKRLLTLVNQLLEYRKTETNNKRLCVSHGDIVSAVREISMKYVELNSNPNLVISVNSSVDEMEAWFDKEILTMVLDNLISNAIKYTEAGMITISVMPELREEERWIKISVKDTGHGIGEEALPYIFDRYYQEKSRNQASGTGIGLALVKALVGLHEGEINVESAREVGSCFNIFLRRDCDYPSAIHIGPDAEEAEGAADQVQDAATGRQAPGEGAETGGHDAIEVLVVEDNPDILEYIRQSLAGIYNVKTASNGRDGLEIALRDIPDIVVTDIMMPVMDGMEMTRHIKQNMNTSHVPVVMLTAKDSPADRIEGYEAGVESYITKPFSASLLIARINNVVSRRNMLTEYIRNCIIKGATLAPAGSPAEDTSSPGADVPAADALEAADVMVVADNAVEKAHDVSAGAGDMSAESRILSESLGRLDREFISRLDHAILECENPEKVNLEYLTDVMCMSRPTLYRKMKAVTGMSGNEYIRHVRMTRAKELLLSGKYTISEISDKLGFSSSNYFRETFKSVFGSTPTEYLKSLKSPV